MQLQIKYKLDLQKIYSEAPKNVKLAIWRAFLLGQMSESEKRRTIPQNSAMHLYFKLLSDALNEAGLTMQKVLAKSIDTDWTEKSVKESLWKPIMRNLFVKTSTTELLKDKGEIDQIHSHLTRFLGQEFGFENPEFPHKEKVDIDYPKEEADPSLIPF